MLHTVERVNGPVLWANMHLLFWLSLARFSTSWMDETHGAAAPTALYGFTLLMPGVAYRLLQDAIIRLHGTEHSLAQAVGQDWKGWLSLAGYCTAIAAAFSNLGSAGRSMHSLPSSGSSRTAESSVSWSPQTGPKANSPGLRATQSGAVTE
jgi:uncharacterized membrane protein